MLDFRGWDNTVNRMLNSRALSDYLFLGVSADYGFPVLVPRDRDRSSPNSWVITGSNFEAPGLYTGPVLAQLIAAADRSIVVIDPLGDKAQQWNCKIEADRAGVPFRLGTPTPGRLSHGFNACKQSHLGRQNLNQKIETQMRGLGFRYGPDDGRRGWYSATSGAVASDIAAKYDFESFAELGQLLLDPVAFRFIDGQLWQASAQYRVYIAQLAAIPPLNVTPKTPGVTAGVLANMIDMRQHFHQPMVTYFDLGWGENPTVARALEGLAVYHLLAAAAREENRRCNVELVIAGEQEFGLGLDALFGQASPVGVNVTLVHQHLGQLRRGGEDLAEALECATGLQVVFSPTGQRIRRWIQDTAGVVTRPLVTWSQSLGGGESAADDFRLCYADAARGDLLPRASVTEHEVRAISENDLIRWSANPRIALVRLVTDEGLAHYGGAWIPTLMSFHISPEEHAARRDAPWPEPGPGTIGVPLESDYDRRFKDGPRPSVAKQQFQDRARKVRQAKEGRP